jgi:serine/threonine protein kinase
MLTGDPPWKGYNPMAAVYALADEGRTPELPVDISIECQDFLSQCFMRDSAARPSANLLRSHPWIATSSIA